MHSIHKDGFDASALVDGYIRFGNAGDSIPEMTRPVIVALVSEVLAIARKERYEDLSTIAGICDEQGSEAAKLERIAVTCRDRMFHVALELPGQDSAATATSDFRYPARHEAPGRFLKNR